MVVQVVLVVRDSLGNQEYNQLNQILQQFYNMEIPEEIKLAYLLLELQVAAVVQALPDKQDQILVQDLEVSGVLEDNILNLQDHLLDYRH